MDEDGLYTPRHTMCKLLQAGDPTPHALSRPRNADGDTLLHIAARHGACVARAGGSRFWDQPLQHLKAVGARRAS